VNQQGASKPTVLAPGKLTVTRRLHAANASGPVTTFIVRHESGREYQVTRQGNHTSPSENEELKLAVGTDQWQEV
jgi:hypothetical protein